MNRSSSVALIAILSCVMAKAAERRVAVPVFVAPTTGDDGQFSDLLKVELMKCKGLIKAKVDIVWRLEDARYMLEVSISYQRGRRNRTIWQTERATAVASAMAYDACGRLVWSKVKDRDIFGDADGVIETAQNLAGRLSGQYLRSSSVFVLRSTEQACRYRPRPA